MRRKRWRAQSKAFSKTEQEKGSAEAQPRSVEAAAQNSVRLSDGRDRLSRCLGVALQDGRHDHGVLGVALGYVLGRKTSWLVRKLF
jgi:hypothetical protein